MQASLPQPTSRLANLGLLAGLTVAVALVMLLFVQLFGSAEPVTASADYTLTAEKMRFSQPELHVQAGERVELHLANADLFGHSFDIDALGVHVEMPARETATASFTAPEPGTYTITCNVPGHAEAGMVGTLVVEP